MIVTGNRNRLTLPAALIVGYAVAMAVVFRVWIASGFDLGFGDRGDGLIEIALLEHWRNVFHGWEAWNVPRYFHPYPDVLGYNDGSVLAGAIYTVWRLWFDPFVADMLVVATWKTIGFFGAYWFVAHGLRRGGVTAIWVAVMFTIAHGMMVQADHAQLNTIALVPLAAGLGAVLVRAAGRGDDRRARLAGIALAVLMGAWLITAYYMAWFTLWFFGLFAASWFLTVPDRMRALALMKRHAVTLALTGGGFVIASLPFLAVYLPKFTATGGQTMPEIMYYLILPVDPMNVGTGHYSWGWIYRALTALLHLFAAPGAHWPENRLAGEHVSGFPLLMFALIVVSLWRALRDRSPERQVVRALAWAIVIGWFFTLNLWYLSPWRIVFSLVPGARGLRVVMRFQLFLILPTLVLIVLVQRDRFRRFARRRPALAIVALLLLFGEQLGAMTSARLSRAREQVLDHLPPPPGGCEAFYVVKARRFVVPGELGIGDPLYPHNTDAMYLSERWRLPTIGGISTFNPPDWNFARPTDPDYDARAAAYARRHGIGRLCRLDARAAAPWRIVPVPAR